MGAWVKRHKILTGLLVVFVLPLVTLGSLNYSGFCIPEGRWLSDKEKIRRVVEYQNSRSSISIDSVSRKYIPYNDANDLMNSNPNCCWIGRENQAYGIPPAIFFDRITGYNADEPIITKFLANYIDEQGIQQSKEVIFENVLMNCGHIKW